MSKKQAIYAVFGGLMLAGVLAGCGNRLETGYEPSKLGATPAQRRGFYAADFTPEAKAAKDRDDELSARNTRPGY